jgi:hypothetical protein
MEIIMYSEDNSDVLNALASLLAIEASRRVANEIVNRLWPEFSKKYFVSGFINIAAAAAAINPTIKLVNVTVRSLGRNITGDLAKFDIVVTSENDEALKKLPKYEVDRYILLLETAFASVGGDLIFIEDVQAAAGSIKIRAALRVAKQFVIKAGTVLGYAALTAQSLTTMRDLMSESDAVAMMATPFTFVQSAGKTWESLQDLFHFMKVEMQELYRKFAEEQGLDLDTSNENIQQGELTQEQHEEVINLVEQQFNVITEIYYTERDFDSAA